MNAPAPEPVVHGRVQGSGGRPADATLALVDMRGRQHDRTTTGAEGHYRLTPREPGYYLLICTPVDAPDAAPHANWVSVDGCAARHDIVLPDGELGGGERPGPLVACGSGPASRVVLGAARRNAAGDQHRSSVTPGPFPGPESLACR